MVRALGPIFVFFVAAGIATVMLGPLLPALMQQWQVRDAQAGTLFTVSFLGQLCGSWLAPRNQKASIVCGAALPAAGCAVLTSLSFGAAHIVFFAIGLGLGAGLTAGNVIVGTAGSESPVRLLTMLNVAWGVGAIACPVLIRLTAAGGIQPFLYVVAACLGVSALLSAAIPYGTRADPERGACVGRVAEKQLTRTAGMPMQGFPLLIFSGAMFLYIGVENSLAGWLPSYAVRSDPALRASSVSLLFWSAELAGRLLLVTATSVISESGLYRVCISVLIGVAVVLCLVVHPSGGSVMVLTVLTGLCLAPLYPLVLSFLLGRTGNHARLGVFFAAASCGGAMLPWLTGVASTRFHGLRAGLLIPNAGAVLLFLISSVVTAKVPVTVEVSS